MEIIIDHIQQFRTNDAGDDNPEKDDGIIIKKGTKEIQFKPDTITTKNTGMTGYPELIFDTNDDNKKYDVFESSGKLYFSKNSIFEGRLLTYENSYYFTGNFCFHPEDSKKFIKSEIKKVFSLRKINVKELKLQNIKLKDENKKLNKTISRIEKLQEKIKRLDSEKTNLKIKNDLSELESIKKKHEENYSLLKQNINTFTHEKIIRENQSTEKQLMLKLASMRLLLDRSRNIALKDIYKN